VSLGIGYASGSRRASATYFVRSRSTNLKTNRELVYSSIRSSGKVPKLRKRRGKGAAADETPAP